MSTEPNINDDSAFAADLIEIIQNSKIFSEVDRAACESLLPRLAKVTLKQGDILFEQGSVSDCLYILVEGQLLASLSTPDGKQKIVGTVEKGETVGELGALSNQPRTLTIRAAVDSRLLKLTRHELEEFGAVHPKIISRIIDLIITRSQTTIKLISEKKIYKHVAIIRGHDEVNFERFLNNLKINFDDHGNAILVEHSPDHSLSHVIDEAEENGKSVIFILNEENIKSLSTKLNHIGGIYVVANGDMAGKLNNFALKMLGRHQTPFTTQYELVLLHDDKVEKPQGTKHWLDQDDFTLYHHIHLNGVDDYKRLVRFILGKALGIVFGGGGGKASVFMGAIKALEAAGIPIDAVGGTSAGSVVAGCYALKRSYEATLEIYKIIVDATSRLFTLKSFTWPIISLISTSESTEGLKKIFGDTRVEDLWIPYYAVSSNLTQSKEGFHRQGVLWEVIRASCAIPGVAAPMVIDGDLHYDGGLLNNLPIDHMRTLLGDESSILAVSLTGNSIGNGHHHYHFPPALPFRVGFLRKLGLGYKDYHFPPFLHTFIQSLLLGASFKEKANKLKADIVVNPDLSGYKFFDISNKHFDALSKIGYEATKKELIKKNWGT